MEGAAPRNGARSRDAHDLQRVVVRIGCEHVSAGIPGLNLGRDLSDPGATRRARSAFLLSSEHLARCDAQSGCSTW